MKSIPVEWLGEWTDGVRVLGIRINDEQEIVVSVTRDGIPYRIDNTGFDFPNQTINLKSEWVSDRDGRIHLQVEAGSPGIGPAYKLYFVQRDSGRLATPNDSIEQVRIQPTIGVGLYDEWEDDLGVPWALPLIEYKKLQSPGNDKVERKLN